MNSTRSLLHESPAALARIAEQVEELTGIPAGHVEKDFWVTEVLRSIASYGEQHNVDVIFKGGTSLSKAFRLIQRFSEDVDILVALTDRSAPEVADHMAAIIDAAAIDTGLHAITRTSAKPSDIKRAATLAFSATNPPGGTRDGVLLELGTRGGTQPMQRLQIRSLVAEHAQTHGIDIGDYADIPFAIHVMRPVRTLIEKLMIVHHAAQSNDTDEQQRHARHYYDIWCLLTDTDTVAALTETPAQVIAREVETFTRDAGEQTSPRPENGFAASTAFGPKATAAISSEYDTFVLQQFVWPGAPKPTLEECLEAVHDRADLL